MLALRDEASREKLPLVVHANAVESWRAALDVHADVIAHGLWHWPGDQLNSTPPADARDVVKAAAKARVGVQPILRAVYGDLSIFDKSLLNERESNFPSRKEAVGDRVTITPNPEKRRYRGSSANFQIYF